MLETNSLFVSDEDGTEKRMEILFTFEDEDHKKNYVVFVDPEKEESDEVFASAYDEDGNLLPVETEKEWQMIEEVIGAFQSDEQSDEEAE